jgi:hypothetical protein
MVLWVSAMLSLTDLLARVAACVSGEMSASDFEDWFQRVSWGMYDRRGDPMSDAIAAVESVLSGYDLGEISEGTLREELASAIHPFAQPGPVYARAILVEVGTPRMRATSTSAQRDFVYSVAVPA